MMTITDTLNLGKKLGDALTKASNGTIYVQGVRYYGDELTLKSFVFGSEAHPLPQEVVDASKLIQIMYGKKPDSDDAIRERLQDPWTRSIMGTVGAKVKCVPEMISRLEAATLKHE